MEAQSTKLRPGRPPSTSRRRCPAGYPYYEKRIKAMPVKVLAKHGVVTKNGDLVLLAAKSLNLEQRSLLRLACEEKLREFIADPASAP